jgi:CheY-like chemotaxis protein
MVKTKTILVVEDDPDDQEVLSEVLNKIDHSYIVNFFDSGYSLIQYLKQTNERPLLILCDINMPLLTGLDLREALVKDPYLKKRSIPFVFYSTAATPEQVELAFELTVQGFFLKGQTIAEIERCLKLILDYWSVSKHP